MKLKLIPLYALTAALASCNFAKPTNEKNQAKIATDTLSYQYKTIKERAADCGSKPDSSCTLATIKYPAFDNEPALNDTINLQLANLFTMTGKGDANTLHDAATGLINKYTADKKTGNPHIDQMNYTLDSHATVIRQDSTLVTVELSGYEFEGGAHGITLTKYINWDTKANKTLQLQDILVEGYQQKLNQIAEKIFRQEELLSDTTSLARDYFFKDGKFSLNNNFVITPTGLSFLYNPYEIKPYAAGQTIIEIPYNQIKKLLRPGTPAAIYIP